ncbi:hypothetical protein RUND412_008983 [Rhizina undulata]
MTLIDKYNFPGNLIIESAETLKIKVIDAHKEIPNSKLLITAIFNRSLTAKSKIRIYNVSASGLKCTKVNIDSPQQDINKITIFPCNTYVMSNTTDNITILWDIRKTNKKYVSSLTINFLTETLTPPLLEGKKIWEHDGGATWISWGPNNDLFFAGDADGVVKAWNIKSGDLFVKDICMFISQVMYSAFSPNLNKPFVGKSSGTATLYSLVGSENRRPGKFDVDIKDIQQNIVEDAEVAANTAQELPDRGKVKIINGVAWGV